MNDLLIAGLAAAFPFAIFGLAWVYAYLRYGPVNGRRKARYPVKPW